jgi:hypothetical protein
MKWRVEKSGGADAERQLKNTTTIHHNYSFNYNCNPTTLHATSPHYTATTPHYNHNCNNYTNNYYYNC